MVAEITALEGNAEKQALNPQPQPNDFASRMKGFMGKGAGASGAGGKQ